MNKLNFKNGIKFSCQSSGNCCVSRGKHGYVYLSKEDLKKLSSHFNVEINEFKKHNKYYYDKFKYTTNKSKKSKMG